MTGNAAELIFQRLYGQPCWNAKSGYGGFLTMEFGKPSLRISDSSWPPVPGEAEGRVRRVVRARGQWHLWIHSCVWQVFTGEKRVGHSNLRGSSKFSIQRAARELDGQKLVQVTVGPHGTSTVFEFDLGSRLEAKPYNETSDQWLLYEPSGYVFALRGDGCYSHDLGNTPPDEVQYTPLE